MEDRYYVRFKGRVLGPMSGEKTQELVRRGQITRLHELSPDGIEWRKAEEFTEFYPKKSALQAIAAAVVEQEKPKPAEEAEWYVHMDGQNHGPVEESNIRMWISSGRVTTESLVWKDGMAEWMAAELVKPQWFAGRVNSSARSTTSATLDNNAGSTESVEAICLEMRRQQFWIYLTAIVALFVVTCQLLWWGFLMINQIVAPARDGSTVAVGLLATFFGALFSGFGLFCAIQLLRYANSTSVLKHAPSANNLVIAARRLSSMWLFVGIYVLTTVIFFLLLGLLTYVGVLRALYQFSN